jgi:cysteine desulfurase family protein
MNHILYLDNAASSWPKPPSVMEAMTRCIASNGANPGRGSHQMAVSASRILFNTRKNAAKLFGVRNPNDISFALNTTEALNLAIKGFVKEGQHVICTAVEHNSVRRPLEYLKVHKNVELTYVSADQEGNIDLTEIKAAIKPNTSLVVMTHSSNLLGSILPVEEVGMICKEKGVRLLVDAAQSAGVLPIDVEQMGIHMLAFPGHKGLLGPQGTGGLYIHPEIDLEPLIHGGTGSQSEAVGQPVVRPDRYEAGTQNTVGLAGLSAGIEFVIQHGVNEIHRKEWHLTQRIMNGLSGINGINLLGPKIGENRTGIVAFQLGEIDSSEVAFILDQHYGIAVRSGYHCTPLAHQTAGTMENGALRASVGFYTTEEEADRFIAAIQEISKTYH